MSKVNTGQASSTLIPKYIGSDFDKVVAVADNIEQVVIVSNNTEDVGTVADNINYVKEVAEDLHGMPVTMYTGENPPVLNPMPEGVMWYCTTDGRTYVWYTDADSGQWVESAPQSAMKDEATNIFFHSTPSNVNPAYRNATLYSTPAPEAEISVAHNTLNTPVVQAQFIREEALWVDVSVTGAQGIVTLMGYSSGNSQLKAEIITWKNGAEGTSLGASQWVTLPNQPSVISLPVTLANIDVLDAGDSYVVKLSSQMNAGGSAVSTILVDGNTSSRFGIIFNTNLIGLFDGIRDGVVTSAPTENAVYDALQLKVEKSQLAASGGAGLVGGAGQVINSIASLRTLSKTAPSKHAFVTAYQSSLPWVGGGPYCLDAADTTSADNGGTIIVASDGGRWKLVHGGEVSICQFGCVGDDSTDNSAAMDKCILAALAENFVVGIPSGVFRCTVTRNYTLPVKHLLRFRGAGSEVSMIDLTTGGDGWVFTAPPPWSIGNLTSQSTGIHFSGITFCTDNAFVGNGITITSATNPAGVIRFTDVEFMPRAGRDSYWLRAVDSFGFGNTRFTRCKWVLGAALHAGTSAVRVRASSANQNAYVIFDHPQSIWGDKVFDIGDYIEGIYFTQPHAINCNIGIHHYPVSAESGLHIIGGHIAAAQYGVYMRNVVDFVIRGLLVYQKDTDPAWTGIYGQNVGRGSVSGNVVVCGSGAPIGTGIRIAATQPVAGLYGIDISGNTFSLVGDAVSLGSSTSNVNVGPNSYGTVTNKVVNGAGTANAIDKLDYSGTVVVTLNGETSKDVSVNLPTQFNTKPLAGFMQSSGPSPLFGSYQYDASSPSVAVFKIYKGDGSPLPSGNYRFSYIVHE